MICSAALVILGVVALIKGELKITSNWIISSTSVRALALILIVGSIIGGLTWDCITLVTFALVIVSGLLLMERPHERVDNIPMGDDFYQSNSPSTPETHQRYTPPGPAINSWNSDPVDISSLQPNKQTVQEIYEPVQQYYPYMDFSDTIDLPITGTTLISAATQVDTYPVHSDFLVYDIKAAYSRRPGQPILCPKCGGLLKGSSIQPSLGVRKDLHKIELAEYHRFSYLFTCENCKWWCIRENWKSVEKQNTICDYLVAGGIPANKTMSIKYNEVANSQNPEPWAKALIFRDIYEYSERLPENLKIIFPRT